MNREPVRVGQVWQDCDKRMAGRRVTVVAAGPTHATVEDAGGKQTRIRLDRMRPTSTGFRLVSDTGRKPCPHCDGRGYVTEDA